MTFAVLNGPRDYPIESQLRALASNPNSYVVALLDCCREKIPSAMRGGFAADDAAPEEVPGVNWIISFGCSPSSGTPVKSTIAVNYFEHLKE